MKRDEHNRTKHPLKEFNYKSSASFCIQSTLLHNIHYLIYAIGNSTHYETLSIFLNKRNNFKHMKSVEKTNFKK